MSFQGDLQPHLLIVVVVVVVGEKIAKQTGKNVHMHSFRVVGPKGSILLVIAFFYVLYNFSENYTPAGDNL